MPFLLKGTKENRGGIMKDKIFSIYRYSIRKTPKQEQAYNDENDERQVSFNETTPEDLLDSLFPNKDESLSFG